MVSEKEAQEAVKVLLGYIEGEENVDREGLLDTPKRVVESWTEIFAGYNMDASELLQATFNAEGSMVSFSFVTLSSPPHVNTISNRSEGAHTLLTSP